MTTDLSRRSPPLLNSNCALLSDFDGTLVELAAHPDEISPAVDLAGWLCELQGRLENAVAVVTGRQLADIDRHLAPAQLIGVGAHGAELRMSSGGLTIPVVQPLSSELISDIELALAGLPDVWVENKLYAVAVHFRQNPAAIHECCERVGQVVATYSGVRAFDGNAVVEVRRESVSKGTAIHDLLAHEGFRGRVPVFVGDDFADEDGFAVVQSAGGYGVKVGPGTSIARFHLPTVAAVHGWLHASLMQLSRAP